MEFPVIAYPESWTGTIRATTYATTLSLRIGRNSGRCRLLRPSHADCPEGDDETFVQDCRCGHHGTAALAGRPGSVGAEIGGILKMPDFASPASMSIHEEASPKSKCPRVQSADLPIPLPTTPASGLGTLRVSLPRAAISMPRWCVSTSTGCGCSGLGRLEKHVQRAQVEEAAVPVSIGLLV